MGQHESKVQDFACPIHGRLALLPGVTPPQELLEKIQDPWIHLPHHSKARWARIVKLLGPDMKDMNGLQAILVGMQTGVGAGDLRSLEAVVEELQKSDQNFWGSTMRSMQDLALSAPSLFPEKRLPLLHQGVNAEVTLSQAQVACLVVHGFFCTGPPVRAYVGPAKKGENRAKKGDGDIPEDAEKMPSLHFGSLFASSGPQVRAKLLCFFNYFSRLREAMPEGSLTFARHSLESSRLPDWAACTKPLAPLQAVAGLIEDIPDAVHTDFANQYLGGGVLQSGCVQEEIMFAVRPECLVSMLLSTVLADNEAFSIVGPLLYSKHTGYGRRLEYAGDAPAQHIERDAKGRARIYIIAIDATPFGCPSSRQFADSLLVRELHKAYVGFSAQVEGQPVRIATGNWGCGVFGGIPELKMLLQWMAASEAGRPLVYCIPNIGHPDFTPDMAQDLQQMVAKNCSTVGDVWRWIKATHKGWKAEQGPKWLYQAP